MVGKAASLHEFKRSVWELFGAQMLSVNKRIATCNGLPFTSLNQIQLFRGVATYTHVRTCVPEKMSKVKKKKKKQNKTTEI